MGYFDSPLTAKITFGALCLVVLLWLITACVDIVNFPEDHKTVALAGSVTGNVATSSWNTTVAMTVMSSVSTLALLIGVGVAIYLHAKK
jgi:hypothetical protein